MLFELNESAFIDGQFVVANAQFPVRINLPDERTDLVSLQWLAVDDAAKKAQVAHRERKNKDLEKRGLKHRVEIVRSHGTSQVPVAGGKKVVQSSVQIEQPAAEQTPVISVGANPIGA